MGRILSGVYVCTSVNESHAFQYLPLEQRRGIEAWLYLERSKLAKPGHTMQPLFSESIDQISDAITKETLTCEIVRKAIASFQRNSISTASWAYQFLLPARSVGIEPRQSAALPYALWKRNCARCQTELESSFDPQKDKK